MNILSRTLPLFALAALVGLAGCGPTGGPSAGANTPTPSPNGPEQVDPAPTLTGKIPVVMETSMGTIELELDADKAPITAQNFVDYARKGFYDGTVFHRVIPTFMIQGGGFTEDLREKETEAPIKNESENGLLNERGTIAMARTGNPDSATSQFFINVVDNPDLNYPNARGHGYAVFGKVTKGMDVVDKIKEVPTTTRELIQVQAGQEMRGPAENVPVDTVLIKSVKIVTVPPAGDATDGEATGNQPADGGSPAEGTKGSAPQ